MSLLFPGLHHIVILLSRFWDRGLAMSYANIRKEYHLIGQTTMYHWADKVNLFYTSGCIYNKIKNPSLPNDKFVLRAHLRGSRSSESKKIYNPSLATDWAKNPVGLNFFLDLSLVTNNDSCKSFYLSFGQSLTIFVSYIVWNLFFCNQRLSNLLGQDSVWNYYEAHNVAHES